MTQREPPREPFRTALSRRCPLYTGRVSGAASANFGASTRRAYTCREHGLLELSSRSVHGSCRHTVFNSATRQRGGQQDISVRAVPCSPALSKDKSSPSSPPVLVGAFPECNVYRQSSTLHPTMASARTTTEAVAVGLLKQVGGRALAGRRGVWPDRSRLISLPMSSVIPSRPAHILLRLPHSSPFAETVYIVRLASCQCAAAENATSAEGLEAGCRGAVS